MIAARYDLTEAAEFASQQVTKILGQMGQFMTSAPEVKAEPISWEL